MSKISRKIELTANVLIIAVGLLIVGILAQRYFFPAQTRLQPKLPVVGDKVALANFDWSKSDNNVLLVLRVGCRFCSESAGFYKNLIQQTTGKNVNVVAVLPEGKEDAEKYLKNLGISGIEVRQSELDPLKVEATPTIIVANHEGKVTNVWLGKLKPEKEIEVLARLRG
jgi:thioredoxin-related protein